MDDIGKIESVVLDILQSDAQARNSDDYLYLKVCQRYDANIISVPLGIVLSEFKSYNVPKFASVTRARRKIQAQNPELKAADAVKTGRLEQETLFKEYAVR